MIFLLVTTLLLIITIHHVLKRKSEPPGPLGLPIFGNLLSKIIAGFSGGFIHIPSTIELFYGLQKKYGPIWSIRMGSTRIITLANLDIINEAFINNAELFSGRPKQDAYKIFTDFRGILFSDGEIWKSNRHSALKSLRDLGMGKRGLENRIIEESDVLVKYLSNKNGKPIDSSLEFAKPISNIMFKLIFDKRHDYDNVDFQTYVTNLQLIAHSNLSDKKISLFPNLFRYQWIRRFFPDIDVFFKSYYKCLNFIKLNCENRETSKNNSNNKSIDCVFDEFFINRFSEENSLSEKEKFMEIHFSMFDMFNAGIDTTNNMLSFCCLMLGKNMSIQDELRIELQTALYNDINGLNMEKRKYCPKLLSFMDEVFRFCVLVPRAHHRVIRQCEFNGYTLYPNDLIFGDFYSSFRDSNLFENPDIFNATRFFDEKNQTYVANKFLIPFGVGKRSCIGESIARMELFIILGKILLNFHVKLTDDTNDDFQNIIDGNVSIVHAPLRHYILLENI